jgi:nitrous oxidase accessory protein
VGEKMKKGLTMLVAVMVIFGLICVIGSVVAAYSIWVESDVKGVGLRHPHPYVPDFEMIDLGNGSVSINNNGTNFMRIQAAVDNATAGDTIIVSNGTYIENIKVNKSLTIRSENGSAATIIYALDSKVHVVNVTVNYVNISGFTIVGAYYNAGIYLNEAYNCTLENNNCSHNEHGFLLKNSSDNGVERNTAAENHYGITLICSNNNHVSNNNCSYNQAGIYSNNSLNNNIEWNTCFGNDHEGIRLLNSPKNNIEWNTCLGNCHGGIRLSNSDSTSIANNTCFGNYFEGIKLVKSDSTSIANNICIHNHNGISLCHSNKNVINLTMSN